MEKEFLDLFLNQMLNQTNTQYQNLKQDLRDEIKSLKEDLNRGFIKHTEKNDALETRIEELDRFKWKVVGISAGAIAFIEIASRFLNKLLPLINAN